MLLAYVIVSVVVLVGIFVVTETGSDRFHEFVPNSFWKGFTSTAIFFRIDITLLIFLLPVVVGLFLTSKNDYYHSDIMMVMIMGLLLVPTIIGSITYQSNQPYRLIPLVVFFAISVGTIFSKFKRA